MNFSITLIITIENNRDVFLTQMLQDLLWSSEIHKKHEHEHVNMMMNKEGSDEHAKSCKKKHGEMKIDEQT